MEWKIDLVCFPSMQEFHKWSFEYLSLEIPLPKFFVIEFPKCVHARMSRSLMIEPQFI